MHCGKPTAFNRPLCKFLLALAAAMCRSMRSQFDHNQDDAHCCKHDAPEQPVACLRICREARLLCVLQQLLLPATGQKRADIPGTHIGVDERTGVQTRIVDRSSWDHLKNLRRYMSCQAAKLTHMNREPMLNHAMRALVASAITKPHCQYKPATAFFL